MQESIILTSDNALSVIFDCREPIDFHQYEMSFFKNSIIYTFQDPVKMKRCPYSMLLLGISSNDQMVLNDLFSRIDKSILINDISFINSKEQHENTGVNENKWMITVEIQGIKKSKSIIGPIWNIKSLKIKD